MQLFPCLAETLVINLSTEARITSTSAGFMQFTGYSPEELAGVPVTQILSDDSVFEVPHMLGSARESGCWEGSFVFRCRDGKVFETHGALIRVAGNGDGSQGYLLIANPESSDSEQAGVLSLVATAVRKFAHDLNNPLAVMMGFTQLLLINRDCQGKMRKDVERLYSEQKRVMDVVEKLHYYALSLCERPRTEIRVDTAAGAVELPQKC